MSATLMQHEIPGSVDLGDIATRAAKLYLIASFANPKESFSVVEALSFFGLNSNEARSEGTFDKCSQYISTYMRYYMNNQKEVTAESSINEKKSVLRSLLEKACS